MHVSSQQNVVVWTGCATTAPAMGDKRASNAWDGRRGWTPNSLQVSVVNCPRGMFEGFPIFPAICDGMPQRMGGSGGQAGKRAGKALKGSRFGTLPPAQRSK